ncbi:E3 ubiquitin-protein ligase KEG [Senna tora]|uniref:E3 ubiquitin-protein ligase KEG n=1 Tax=Senna tora TaxID=362788 RepID=A0A834SQ28_9FABA|nr:E3 ubiquitin-protein ligase KEG [Senna tora]
MEWVRAFKTGEKVRIRDGRSSDPKVGMGKETHASKER